MKACITCLLFLLASVNLLTLLIKQISDNEDLSRLIAFYASRMVKTEQQQQQQEEEEEKTVVNETAISI